MKTELSRILGNISNKTRIIIFNSGIALALVGFASFVVNDYDRRHNDLGLTSRQGLTASRTEPYKKTLAFKKALTIAQYEAIRVAHENPVYDPVTIPPVNLPYQIPNYNPSPIIRLPQAAYVPDIQIPNYSVPASVRIPQSSFSLPVTQYDPVEFPPMYFQGPGIPYANPHYIPPITSSSTLYNPSSFVNPSFNNPSTLYNSTTNFTSPTFNNPPTLYNPPTIYNPPTLYNPPTIYNPPTFYNPPPVFIPPPIINFP